MYHPLIQFFHVWHKRRQILVFGDGRDHARNTLLEIIGKRLLIPSTRPVFLRAGEVIVLLVGWWASESRPTRSALAIHKAPPAVLLRGGNASAALWTASRMGMT